MKTSHTPAIPGRIGPFLKSNESQDQDAVSATTAGKRLVIVEDDPQTMKLLSDLLRRFGYEVHQANYPLAGLFTIARVEPDLILADLQMPQVDGLTLIRQLKGHRETANIPVVVVSADDTPESREAAFAAGCQGYITKPVDTRRFPEQIAGFLGKSKPKRT